MQYRNSLVTNIDKTTLLQHSPFITGFLFGILNFFVFGPIYLGEIFLMAYGTFELLRIKNDFVFNRKVISITSGLQFFLIYMGFQSILVGSPFTLINIIKYSVIFYQVLLYTNLFFINKRKYIVIFFTFLLISSLTTLEIRGGILQSFLSTFPFGIILTLFLVFFKKLNLKTLFLFIIILGIYALISYSRTSAVLTLVLSIFLVYSQFFTKQKNKKSFLFKFFAIIVLIIISVYLYFWLFESIQSVSLSNSERLLLIEIAIEEFKISPVFGIGIGNYNNYAQTVLGYQLRANNMSTHNLFLELIAETGAIGLLLFASTLYKLFVLSLSNKNYRSLLLLLVLSFYFLFNVFSGLSRSYFVIFLATSIFLVIRKESFNEFYM
jgi:hypothetical protein